MLTKTKQHIKIPMRDWEEMKKNPTLSDALELLEDLYDIEAAKKIEGKDLTLKDYLKKRNVQTDN